MLAKVYSNIDSTNFRFNVSGIHFGVFCNTIILLLFNSQEINLEPLGSLSFSQQSEISLLF